MHTSTLASPYINVLPYRRQAGDRYFAWLTWSLLGYSLMGRGFAYLGVPPLFVGEVTLVVGLFVWMRARTLGPVLALGPARVLLALIVWGLICTAPYVGTYGVDALRDAVLYGYALFAFVVIGVVVEQPARMKYLFLRYQKFVLAFALLSGPIYILYKIFAPNLPHLLPTVPILSIKGGDFMVHYAGVSAALLVGLARLRLWQAIALVGSAGIVMIGNRGGMVSFACALLFVLWARPPRLRVTKLAYGVVFATLTLLFINPKVQLYPGDRPISVEQFLTNVTSVVGSSGNTSLEGTKKWRMQWWDDIFDYTFRGKYFWTGKGFGINLANDDGYQVQEEDALRSPHNSHMTVLARAGVPGFLLWLTTLGIWLWYVLAAFFRAKRRGDTHWHGIFTFLIAYWIAASLNACFDVYLEGPMGGIWYWCLYGAGIAAVYVYRRHPELAWY